MNHHGPPSGPEFCTVTNLYGNRVRIRTSEIVMLKEDLTMWTGKPIPSQWLVYLRGEGSPRTFADPNGHLYKLFFGA